MKDGKKERKKDGKETLREVRDVIKGEIMVRYPSSMFQDRSSPLIGEKQNELVHH